MGFKIKELPIKWERISQPFKPGKHRGIDLAAPTGRTVRACASGVVVAASYGAWDSSYGKMVAIRHSGGTYTNCAHLSKISVKVGQKVKAGTKIGECGSTGNSTGPHVHFEVHLERKWNRVNPAPYLNECIQDALKPKKKKKKPVKKKYYKVKRGDTLGEIAKKKGTTVKRLKVLNGIKNADLIYVGQKLRIR